MAGDDQEVVGYRHNTSVAIVIRLANLWEQANYAALQSNYIKWNMILDRIWSELSEKKDDSNKMDERIKKFNKNLTKEGLFSSTNYSGFDKPSVDKEDKRAKQYAILIEKEIFLRQVQREVGKGSQDADTAEGYME